MGTPNYSLYADQALNSGIEDPGFAPFCLFTNIVVGANPAYAITDFVSMYPRFGTYNATAVPAQWVSPIPIAVINAYIAYASACLQSLRWCDLWTFGMSLFVAHYCTLWLQTETTSPNSNGAQIAATGLATGVRTAKSAGDVSTSFTPLELPNAGQWALTVYGQQFWSLARAVGAGSMLIL